MICGNIKFLEWLNNNAEIMASQDTVTEKNKQPNLNSNEELFKYDYVCLWKLFDLKHV